MSIVDLYDLAFEETINGKPEKIDSLIVEIAKEGCSMCDKNLLLSHMEKKYFEANISQKSTIISILFKIDDKVAYEIALRDIESTYLIFRCWGAHMHALISIIYGYEGLRTSTCSIEHDKNMKIAFELIEKIKRNSDK
jgi:hypothetical protein